MMSVYRVKVAFKTRVVKVRARSEDDAIEQVLRGEDPRLFEVLSVSRIV